MKLSTAGIGDQTTLPGRNRNKKTREPKRQLSPNSHDISYLTDRPGRGRDIKDGTKVTIPVPDTMIPEKYHVVEKTVTPPLDETQKTVYDESERMWSTTVFPSVRPSGRREVLLLDRWLNQMLQENMAKNSDPLEAVKEAQRLYSMCFHEIIRQIWVHCAERGLLMEKIWNRYLQLFEHILKMREHERDQYNKKIQEHQLMYQQLYRDKDEKFNKMYLQLAAEKERICMAKDKLERAVLVLQEEYKKRIQKEIKLKKYLKNLKAKGFTEDTTPKSTKSDDEEDVLETHNNLLSNLDISSFSDSNLVLVNKLEFIALRLSDILRAMNNTQKTSNWDANYGKQMQIETILETLGETIKRMNQEEDRSLAKARGENVFGSIPTARPTHSTVEKSIEAVEPEMESLIPKTFHRYFARPLKVPIPRILPKEWVFKYIALIYSEKILADEEHDRATLPRQEMPEFVYEFFLQLYGIRKAAELHLVDFLSSVSHISSRKYHQNLRIRIFAQFCGLFTEDEEQLYTLQDLNAYLYMYALCQCPPDGSEPEQEDEEGRRQLTLDHARSIVVALFEKDDELNERVESLVGEDGRLDMDQFLETMLAKAHSLSDTLQLDLMRMFSVDNEDQRGVLTYDEFIYIFRKLNPHLTYSDREIIHIFREVLENGRDYRIDAMEIKQVFHKHQLLNRKSIPNVLPILPQQRSKTVFGFLETAWQVQEPKIAEMMRNLQGGLLIPKTYQHLQDYEANFKKLVAKREDPDAALKSYRLYMSQLYCAKMRPNRIVGSYK